MHRTLRDVGAERRDMQYPTRDSFSDALSFQHEDDEEVAAADQQAAAKVFATRPRDGHHTRVDARHADTKALASSMRGTGALRDDLINTCIVGVPQSWVGQ